MPRKNALCHGCGKRGHFVKMYRSRLTYSANALVGMQFSAGDKKQSDAYMATLLAGAPTGLDPAVIKVKTNRKIVEALIDSGASKKFIDRKVVEELKLRMHGSPSKISMASTNCSIETLGRVRASVEAFGKHYKLEFGTMNQLCSDVILGHPFLRQHSEVSFQMGGPEAPIKILKQDECLAVAATKAKAPRLFRFLTDDCKPFATKSRKYSVDDQKFIADQIKRMLAADIIEPSQSP